MNKERDRLRIGTDIERRYPAIREAAKDVMAKLTEDYLGIVSARLMSLGVEKGQEHLLRRQAFANNKGDKFAEFFYGHNPKTGVDEFLFCAMIEIGGDNNNAFVISIKTLDCPNPTVVYTTPLDDSGNIIH